MAQISKATRSGNKSRWVNSPNVYQKVEVLETGTQDPKKITKVTQISFDDAATKPKKK